MDVLVKLFLYPHPLGRSAGSEREKTHKNSRDFDKTDRAPIELFPAGTEATRVKQVEMTIRDKNFYGKLFAALEKMR